jgi:hypothetical protein
MTPSRIADPQTSNHYSSTSVNTLAARSGVGSATTWRWARLNGFAASISGTTIAWEALRCQFRNRIEGVFNRLIEFSVGNHTQSPNALVFKVTGGNQSNT